MSSDEPPQVSRTLYTHPSTAVYAVPPLTSNSRGYTSTQWTAHPPIFTARLRILEVETASAASSTSPDAPPKVAISLLLTDPASNELFAEAPYTHPAVVTPCVDSGRYFAVRVQDGGGRKATLGIGFEDRAEAFNFVGALGDVGRVLGFVEAAKGGGGAQAVGEKREKVSGLGEGKMVRLDLPGVDTSSHSPNAEGEGEGGSDIALFTIKPPPAPPADSEAADEDDADTTRLADHGETASNEDSFEDAEFGDFQ